jgi:bifunctional UDP-N-acetylglucosamine pyrophosphorylase/glucosamine-1-phosphate N-acetyltransferase
MAGRVGDLFVGGMSLAEWQERLAPEGDLTLRENAWVAEADWALLAGMEGVAKLETHDGDALAWTGTGGEPAEGVVAMASEDSLLVTHSWDLLRVNEQLLGQLSESCYEARFVAPVVDGVLVAGEGTVILPGVFVEGTVVIGNDCKIGPNCYLRGSTTIGDKCHIGQAVEVKNSIIGHGSSVGHLSYVGDSIIGRDVNFGAGTITSNLRHDGRNHRTMVVDPTDPEGYGAATLVDTGRRKFGTVIGDCVHTGIHTAIYPGRKLGPGTITVPNETVDRDKV